MYGHHEHVTFSQVGPDGKQTPFSIISMMQDCSMLWLKSEPVLVNWMHEENTAMLIANRQVDIYHRPAYDEHVTIATSVYQCKGSLGWRNTLLYDEQGDVAAASWGIGPFVNYGDSKIVAVPKEVMQSVTIDPKFDMDYLPRKVKVPATEAQTLPAFTAANSDIDMNRHVNNAQYVRIASNLLDPAFEFNRIRIEYKAQARRESLMHPSLYEEGSVKTVVLASDEGAPYCITEFSSF